MSKLNLAYQDDQEFYPEAPHVRRVYISPEQMNYETMSEFGKEIYRLSEEYATSGEKLYTEEEIEKEIARRKGGYIPDGNDDDDNNAE
ncbi:MAG: hypothetical protein ACRD82_05940 [Blastocatellia bacterium]